MSTHQSAAWWRKYRATKRPIQPPCGLDCQAHAHCRLAFAARLRAALEATRAADHTLGSPAHEQALNRAWRAAAGTR